MSLKWTIKNHLEAWKYRKTGSGVLAHKKDPRDHLFGLQVEHEAKQERLSLDTGVRFDQKYLNICVFASRVQGFSMQEGIRFSVRWDVKLARKLGMTTRDGWSYLRAENDIGVKYGRLPYEYMPDEIGNMNWQQYSTWTQEDEDLLEIAAQFKTPEYKRVVSKEQAIQALEAGYCLFTAGKWYDSMFAPQPPSYLLLQGGRYAGGHAYIATGYRGFGDDFENPQTYGTDYGDKGVAWIDNIIGQGQYDIYIEEHLPKEVKEKYVKEFYDGKAIKTLDKPEIYAVVDGKKKYIPTMEEFTKQFSSFVVVDQTILDLIPNAEV